MNKTLFYKVINIDDSRRLLKSLKKCLFMVNDNNEKANATQWMIQFIKECERLEISEEMRSYALRMFIGKSLNDWYLSNTMKLQQSD